MLARFLLGNGEIRESESVWWVLSGEGGRVKANGGRQCLWPGQAESTPALFVPCEWDWPSDIMEPGGCLPGSFSSIRIQSLAFLTCERFPSASVGLKYTNYSPGAKSTSVWKLLSCVWLFATPWTIQSLEFSRPEYWRRACPFSSGSSRPSSWTWVSGIAGRFFSNWAIGEAQSTSTYQFLRWSAWKKSR